MKKNLVAIVIFILFYNLFFFKVDLGIGAGVLLLGLHLFLFFTKSKNSANTKIGFFFSSLAVVFAFLFGLRDSQVIQVLNLVVILFSSFASLYFYKSDNRIEPILPKFLIVPLLSLKDSAGSLFSIFGNKENSSSVTGVYSYIRGFIFAVLLGGVLLALLINADPIFGHMASSALENIGERVIISIFLFLMLIAFAVTVIKDRFKEQAENIIQNLHERFNELTIVLGAIVLLFAAFLVVQFRYLFSNVSIESLSEIGINSETYSEYVRKGFFELLIVILIVGGLVAFTLRFLHSLKGSKLLILRFLTAGIILETGFIIASSVQRLSLYAGSHGLTRARIYGLIFLVWLSVSLVLLLIRTFKEFKPKLVFWSFFTTTLLILFITNIINIDGIIATKYRPSVNQEIDYFYLASISSDTHPAWKDAITQSSEIITQLEGDEEIDSEENRKLFWARFTLNTLQWQVNNLKDKYDKNASWQSFKWSEYQAYRDIDQNEEIYKKLPTLIEKANLINNSISDEVRYGTQIDRSLNPPLLR